MLLCYVINEFYLPKLVTLEILQVHVV